MARWKRYPRDVQGAWHAIDDLRETVDAMAVADEIAEKVKVALKDERNVHFTLWQKAGGFVLGCFVIAGTIHSWIA